MDISTIKNTAKAVLAIIAILLIILVFIPGNTKNSNKNIAENIKNTMPVPTTESLKGVALNKLISAEESQAFDNFKAWNKTQKAKEKQEEYDAIRNAIKKKDQRKQELEEELEHYCNMLYSNSCLNNLKYIEDHNGKTMLRVKCKRFNDDKICIKYKITVLDE